MRISLRIFSLFLTTALAIFFLAGCSDDDTVAPETDPALPTGIYSGTLFVSYTDHESPAEAHKEFSVDVDSAGAVTISPETLAYNESYTNDAQCDVILSGQIRLAPTASIIVSNHKIVVTMTLSGPSETHDTYACPGQPPSDIFGSSSYTNSCSFLWDEVIGDGAYCLIENNNPPPFGIGSEFRLVLRLSPTS